MKRADAIAHIAYAGYHNDHATALRIYVDSSNRVGFQAYQEAFRRGMDSKRRGVPCGCGECKKGN